MSTVSTTESTATEKIQFRILFSISYIGVFFFVLMNRFLPKKLKIFSSSDSSKSIFRETKEIVYSAIPLAFMG